MYYNYPGTGVIQKYTDLNITIDGIVSVGEYENSLFIDSLEEYKLSYTIDQDKIYFGIEVRARGWVAIGFDPNNPAASKPHNGADIYQGAFSTTSGATSRDAYGDSSNDIKSDSTNNILQYDATQNSSWTIFEFSRNLITGDLLTRDKSITPDEGMNIIWSYHSSIDGFTNHHTKQGTGYVIFYSDTFISPVDSKPNNNTSFNVNIDGVVSPDEYPNSEYMDSLYQYKMYYGIVNGTAYFGLQVQSKGYIAIGFKTTIPSSNQHSGADIILGAYDIINQVTVFRDDYGDSGTTHKKDTDLGGTMDILNVSASENATFTTLEFSKPLNSGDPYDQVLTPESPIYVMWSYHTSLDDMTTIHSAKGFKLITFHDFSGNVTTANPTAPYSPVSLKGNFLNDQVYLNWSVPDFDGNDAITNYNIYRRLDNETNFTFIGSNGTNLLYVDLNVAVNLTYYYVVTAENTIGESVYSNEISVPTGLIPIIEQKASNTFNVTIDGVVSENEYPNSMFMDSKQQYKLSYGIVNGTAYFALEVQTTGWLAIAFKTTSPNVGQHKDADVILGAYDTVNKTTVWRDDFGDTNTTHVRDTDLGGSLDLLNVSASENATWTTLEFSRYLDTKDPYDQVLTPETPLYVMWSFHTSLDDMQTIHSSKGYNPITLHEFTGEPTTNEPTVPFAPQSLNASVSNNGVLLSWLAPPFDGNSPITNYNVYRRLYNESTYIFVGVNSSTLSFVDSNVVSGIAYYYVVTAENIAGESLNSNSLRVIIISTTIGQVTGQNTNTNTISNTNSNNENLTQGFPEIPLGLGWALSIPVVYSGMFLVLGGVIKYKSIKSRSY
jgi:fibronectin type 3 domain-containing protein